MTALQVSPVTVSPSPTTVQPLPTTVVERLVDLGRRGLRAAYDERTRSFPQTMRGSASPTGPVLMPEGTSPRYAAIAALGLSRLPVDQQRDCLAGSTADELTGSVVGRAINASDPGLLALAAWASAEVAGEYAADLFEDLGRRIGSNQPIPTVDLSWILTAAVAAIDLGPTADLARVVAARLMAAQSPSGAFGHVAPRSAQSRYRRHVGCFADQVYPIQALSRWSRLSGSLALRAAERTATVITDQQGPHGQWWWHYDVRDGSVVEGYPVYSVHQHAMGPMALADLHAAGGPDHSDPVERGLAWLTTHPEVVDDLIQDRLGVVWRKVGRRERAKAVRAVSALSTSVRPGWHLPGIDRLSPPGPIDHECRPYELGWLLYAWATPVPVRAEES